MNFVLPEHLLAKASFRVSGGFSVSVFKKLLVHSPLFPEGETARFAGGVSFLRRFENLDLMTETSLLHCAFRRNAIIDIQSLAIMLFEVFFIRVFMKHKI